MRSKIRILYFYPYLQFDTGSPKAMVQFIDTLDRELFQPVFCAAGTGALTEALAARQVEIVPGGTESISQTSPLAAAASIRRQMALLKSWKIDLLHANCFPWNTDLILAAWMSRIPIILHVHNPIEVASQNLVRLAAHRVLFCSRSAIQSCGHFNRVAHKAEVFYNMIDTGVIDRGRPIRSSLGLQNGDVAIGTVASLVHGKGIDILLETARVLLQQRSDLVFLIAGSVAEREEEFGRRVMAAAEEPSLRGRVRFLGSRSDIPDFLASLDLFVLPTRAETLGIVVLEAMAAGLPVIASKVGGIPEMLTSAELGVAVDQIRPDAFADAIQEVLRLPDRGKSMGANARVSLMGRFDVAAGKEHLQKIYLDSLRTCH